MRVGPNIIGPKVGVGVSVLDDGAGLLLDTYTASYAYSMRLLTETHRGGLSVRLRRDSDNAESNFGYDSNDEWSPSATELSGSQTASAWGSAASTFVVQWADQVGGQTVAQNLAQRQPRASNAGTFHQSGGKYALEFDYIGHTDDTYLVNNSSLVAMAQPMTHIAVVDWEGTSGNPGAVVGWDNAQAYIPISASTVGNQLNSAGVNLAHAITFTMPKKAIMYSMANGTSSEVTSNNETITVGDAGTNGGGSSVFGIGARTGGNRGVDGFIQEVIGFNTDESGNWTAIRDDINAHYSVF